jgi:hypothetical protein
MTLNQPKMTLRNLFTVNIFVAIFFGVTCTFLPRLVSSLYGIIPDEATIWVTRLAGGSILGFATLMWFGIKTASVDARRAIALALIVQDTVGFVASFVFQLTGQPNAFGWSSLAIYGGLSLAYTYFLFARPERV